MPQGVFGDIYFEKSYRSAITLDARVLTHEPKIPLPTVEVELDVGDFRLEGYLEGPGNNGLFYWRSGRKRTKDMLATWIRHLCLCAISPANVPKRSTFVFTNVTAAFREVSDPLVHLQALLELRHSGLMQPQPFFPDTSYAFAAARADDEVLAMQKADSAWFGGSYSRGESNSDLNAIVWRGQEAISNSEFMRLASLVFDPLIQHLDETAEEDELPDDLPDELRRASAGGDS